MVKDGVNPSLLGRITCGLGVSRQATAWAALGPEQQMTLKHTTPTRVTGFASVVMSLKDLSS